VERTRSYGSRRVTLILSSHPLSFETPALILSSPSSFETAVSRPPQDEGCEGRGLLRMRVTGKDATLLTMRIASIDLILKV
jgi:hypothetical protein